jgi:hypothetical protein
MPELHDYESPDFPFNSDCSDLLTQKIVASCTESIVLQNQITTLAEYPCTTREISFWTQHFLPLDRKIPRQIINLSKTR